MSKASDQLLLRLRHEASAYERPDVRKATIERLVLACSGVENGDGLGSRGVQKALKITASSVERYVKMRFRSGDPEWQGPTRAFLSGDPGLRAYIQAREDERVKPVGTVKRSTSRLRQIEDAISKVSDVETRQLLRFELEEGRVARKRLDILSSGLRSIPNIDVDALLQNRPPKATERPASETAVGPELSSDQRSKLTDLVRRLSDSPEMARCGLLFQNHRLKLARAPGSTIIKPEELRVILRLINPESDHDP